MTITSKGYGGTVDYADWAVMTAHFGARYSVFGAESFQAAVGSGDREVTLLAGSAAGPGIYDVSNATVTVTGASVSAGSRWDLVALRRDWAAETTTPVIITGTSTRALPAGRQTAIGDVDDQPLWLVRFAAGQTAVQELIDLRCWHGPGGMFAKDLLVRDYLDKVGTVVRVAGVDWQRNLNSVGTEVWERRGAPVAHEMLGNPLTGITVPSTPIAAGALLVKTGMVNTFTTTAFGNEYSNEVVFDSPFPNACLTVQVTEIHVSSAVASGRFALDIVAANRFRVVYPGSTSVTNRAFLWSAIGY